MTQFRSTPSSKMVLTTHPVTRRTWLATTTAAVVGAGLPISSASGASAQSITAPDASVFVPSDVTQRIDADAWEALAVRAVDAARSAGAQYADARLVRTVRHGYGIVDFRSDATQTGIGVRALFNGYWGYAAQGDVTDDNAVRLARAAVEQAKTNAKGTPRTVDMGRIPTARGRWATPVKIDPFTVSIEEKIDFIASWANLADYQSRHVPDEYGAAARNKSINGVVSWLNFVRQERVVATTDGALFTQTLYESGGVLLWGNEAAVGVLGIESIAKGWELFLEANIPEQITGIAARLYKNEMAKQQAKSIDIGRKTLVCDGRTMAAMLEQTIGSATQIDRALGFEANAGGTSFIDDPLTMVGELQIGSKDVTVTANRSAATQLATVKWDDEGVAPEPFTLVKSGVLTDFQTTREQAAWLTPYYQQHNKPLVSHGCAAAESALATTMQHMPNLALEPSAATNSLDDLIADVSDGICVTGGQVSVDAQARNGMLSGRFREIKNGRLGSDLLGGVVLFNTLDFWKNVNVVGGSSTQDMLSFSQYANASVYETATARSKGQPAQITSHSVTAAAATIKNQALIDPRRRS